MPARTSNPDLARKVGNRVRQLRESHGITQEAAAWAADLSKGYLSRVEAGLHLPSLDALERLANCLDVPLEALVTFPAGNASPANPPAIELGRASERQS